MEENLKNKNKESEEKITFTRILMYFIIYSILGFIVETIFGMLTKGVVESRKSCLYGPFCCIYGLGAAVMIPSLKKFRKSNWGLFIAGMIIGSLVEYIMSWLGEALFQIKWWDYSHMPLNINGRICILFTVFWGILSLALYRLLNPFIEKCLNKIPKKAFKNIAIIGFTLIVLDTLFTGFGLKIFYTKLTKEYNLSIKGENVLTVKEKVLEYPEVKWLSSHIFTYEKILKTFPNIKIEDTNGNIIWIKDLLPYIQPYYFKISNKIFLK